MTIFDTIKSENRDEILAIPFYGWLKNPIECMIRYVMKSGKYTDWCKKYDFFRIFPIDDPFRMFSLSMQYTINSFKQMMVERGKVANISEQQIEADFCELIERADPNIAAESIMLLIIQKLLTEDFIKSVHIYNPVINDNILKYLRESFDSNTDRIIIHECNVRQIIESQNPKYTTVFVEDLDFFMDILQLYGTEEKEKYMSNTYYILPAKSSLTDSAKQLASTGILPPGETAYKYQKFIEESLRNVHSYANFLQLKMINIK